MHRFPRIVAVAAVSAFLLGGAAACGSSGGSDDASGDATSTTVAETSDDAASPDDDGATDAGTSDDGDAHDCSATAESNNLSGDAVVLFSADQDELSESDLTDDDVATIAADASSMDPAEIEAPGHVEQADRPRAAPQGD